MIAAWHGMARIRIPPAVGQLSCSDGLGSRNYRIDDYPQPELQKHGLIMVNERDSFVLQAFDNHLSNIILMPLTVLHRLIK